MESHDFIVVGAGSAGCVLASRLTEAPEASVLLLEAGAERKRREIGIPAAWPMLFKTECDWGFTTAPQEQLHDRAVHFPRGKVLGGSSSTNAQIFLRGHRADFDGWAALGNPGWSYEDVLPHFKRLETNERGDAEWRGTNGPLSVADARWRSPLTDAFVQSAVKVGLAWKDDLNDGDLEGVGYCQFNQRNGARHATDDAYLRPAIQRRNLRVLCDLHVTRVVFDGVRAIGVEYIRGGERHEARANREIILSAGAIGSPQLLLLSGIGPVDHLKEVGVRVAHPLPGVGQNLQDHVVLTLLYPCSKPVSLYSARSLLNVLRYLVLRRGPLASSGAEAVASVRSRPDLAAPDLGLLFVSVLWLNEGLEPPPRHGFSIGVGVLAPRSTGEVRLRSSDPTAPPRIDPRFLSDGEARDLGVLLDGIRLARRIADTEPLTSLRGDEIEPGPERQSVDEITAFVRSRAQTYYHPAGTCKMGTDPQAVVDPRLRVHGIERLRVVDASIMPAIVRANTNAATIMIAEKAADLIKAGD